MMPTDPASIPQDVIEVFHDTVGYVDEERVRLAFAAALDALMDDAAMDRLIEEIIVSLGGERGVTDDRLPLARWDMKRIVRKAVLRAD